MNKSDRRNPIRRAFPVGTALLAFVLAAAGAQAADLVPEQPPQPPEVPPAATYLWSGTYVGVYGAYNWLEDSLTNVPDAGSVHGATAGAYLGYNYQFPTNWVTGVEGTAGFSGVEGNNAGTKVDQDWEASLRGRLGYAFENSLFYGLAGLAGTGIEVSTPTGSDSNVLLGWQVGAGLETFLTENITGRIEYDYTDYGSTNFSPGAASTELGVTGHAVKIGLGLKF